MKQIIFLCDRKKECSNYDSCGVLCTHTGDMKHAKNGVTFDVDHSDRFFEQNRFYWEKEERR